MQNEPDCLDRNKEKNDGFVEVKSKNNGGMEDRVKRQNSRVNFQPNKFGNNHKVAYQAKNKTHPVRE
ncbi:hypothetical protein Tco_0014652 [Tanacetum coccineum]